jgi:DNA-binding IclR family transcriptional regulator
MGRNDVLAGMASVRKAFALLDVVASNNRGMSAKEIAAALDMPLPTVYRLLKTLVVSEHLVHLKDESRYALGYKLHALDTSLRRQVGTPPSVARLIRELHIRADAAAYYAVHRGDDIVVAHVVDSPTRPRITPIGFGFNDAAHATAFGKVLLAAMDPDQRWVYLERHGLPEMTDRTIGTNSELEAQLRAVREDGIAVEQEEFIRGASCMAAPVVDAAGQTIGSVAVSMDPMNFGARSGKTGPLLRDAADKVSRALRGTPMLPR